MAKQKSIWLERVINVLNELGGHAYYKDIYELFDIKFQDKTDSWQAQIRATIERYSSDSDTFNGIEDLFFAVEGKGKGHWGIRNFKVTFDNIDLTEDECSFPEGKKRLREHIVRERNPEVVKIAKENYLKIHGSLKCEICNFNYEKVYGEIGKDYIEGHHTIFVSEIVDEYKTRPSDIILLCANCHRMIHRKRPWLSKEKLADLLK